MIQSAEAGESESMVVSSQDKFLGAVDSPLVRHGFRPYRNEGFLRPPPTLDEPLGWTTPQDVAHCL
jgi:hypothetical protein